MASPPVTFPCPFCARRMGVPAELLGRQVRCPHCKQVVVAPAEAGTVPAPAPAPAVVNLPPPPPPPEQQLAPVAASPPPPPEPEPELRPFDLPQQREGADSILSAPEESDDEVFGSNTSSRLRSLVPEPQPPVEPVPAPVGGDVVPPFLTGTVFPFPPAPPLAPAPAPVANLQPLDPFDDLVSTPAPLPPAPASAAPVPQPLPVPAPAPARPVAAPLPAPVAPAPVASANPFAVFDAPPEPVKAKASKSAPPPDDLPEEDEDAPRKKKKKSKDEDAEPEEKPTKPAYGRAEAGSGAAGKTILIVLLAGYAFVATLAAIYGLFFSTGAPTGHPLSTIPDSFGEFDPVSRKKVSKAAFPVDGPLPPEQRAALGDKINIGQLEIQPIKVEKRPLVIQMEGAGGKEKATDRPGKALVLTLDIKNTSPDLSIFPMDPAFTRREGKDDQPITRLVAGKRTFFGGEIEWPLGARYKKKIEVQQANDSIPLKPGESREYVVFTPARLDVLRTAEAEKGPLQWRVQVRRGLIDYKGKEIPVTAVIGVDFKAGDIQTPE